MRRAGTVHFVWEAERWWGAAAHNANDVSMPVARVCRTIHSSYVELLLVTLLLIIVFFLITGKNSFQT